MAEVSLSGLVVDGLEFARQGRRTVGKLEIDALPRLREAMAAASEPLRCEVVGRQEGRKSWLRLRVEGELWIQCQRCLEPMRYELDVDTDLQLIAPGEPWPEELQEDGSLVLEADAVAADEPLALSELIEEEVLLVLPIAPRHERCEPPARNDDKQATSPFAVLAQLKKH